MALFSITRRTVDGTIAAPALEVISNGAQVRIKEITITLAAATVSEFGIGIAAAKGITPTTPKTLIAEDGSAGTSKLSTAVAWATAPTVPAGYFRRTQLAAAVGSTVTYTFPDGLILASGNSLVVWNITATGVADITIVSQE